MAPLPSTLHILCTLDMVVCSGEQNSVQYSPIRCTIPPPPPRKITFPTPRAIHVRHNGPLASLLTLWQIYTLAGSNASTVEPPPCLKRVEPTFNCPGQTITYSEAGSLRTSLYHVQLDNRHFGRHGHCSNKLQSTIPIPEPKRLAWTLGSLTHGHADAQTDCF